MWEIENAHKRKKLRNLVPDVPDVYQGVLLNSSLLEEKFGNPEVKGLILGGLEETVSSNVKEFLKLNLRYRLYPKVTLKASKVDAEARAAKSRWTVRDI